jgi:hypothetical protein
LTHLMVDLCRGRIRVSVTKFCFYGLDILSHYTAMMRFDAMGSIKLACWLEGCK